MRRRKQRFEAREYVIVALLSLALVWLLVLVWGIARKEEIARQAVRETKAELASLGKREATLEADLAALSTERGQEASLRETYGVARPGEEVIIVVPPEASSTPPTLPWWRKALSWVGIW
jgi:cell division protein FtsB